MKLKEILAISGKSGLFKFVSQGRNGIIVESFEDQTRTLVPASAKVSALEDIAIFTETEELPLSDVFQKIFDKESGKETINHKSSNEELKAFFAEILPDYDRDRVYVSDMKKVVLWYNTLLKHDLLKPEEDDKKDEVKEEKTEPESEAKEEAEAKKDDGKPVEKEKAEPAKKPAEKSGTTTNKTSKPKE